MRLPAALFLEGCSLDACDLEGACFNFVSPQGDYAEFACIKTLWWHWLLRPVWYR